MDGCRFVISGIFIALACRGDVSSARDRSVVSASSTPSQQNVSYLTVAGDSLHFIQHDENLPAGFPLGVKPIAIKNPYRGTRRQSTPVASFSVPNIASIANDAKDQGQLGQAFRMGGG